MMYIERRDILQVNHTKLNEYHVESNEYRNELIFISKDNMPNFFIKIK